MSIHDGSERAHVSRESLGEEQIPGASVHVRYSRVPQGMQGALGTEGLDDLEMGDRLPGHDHLTGMGFQGILSPTIAQVEVIPGGSGRFSGVLVIWGV